MGDAVAEAVLAQWAALPKTGKPQPHEHTVLAGIALELPTVDGIGSSVTGQAPQGAQQQQTQQQRGQLAVVAIGTGTKCLGGSKRLPGGAAVNDCHAEALCRRALLRWLYGEMQQAAERCAAAVAGGASPLEAAAAASTTVLRLIPPAECGRTAEGQSAGSDADRSGAAGTAGAAESEQSAAAHVFSGWRFSLQPGVRLHMYISQPPCGDASILHAEGAQGAACQHGSTAGAVAAAGVVTAAPAGEQGGSGGTAAAAGGKGMAESFGRTGAKPLLKRQRLQPAGEEQPAGPSHGRSSEAGQPTQQAEQVQQQQAQQPALPQAAAQEQWRLPQQHEVESYSAAQETGVVRRKPGRGDATLSMSCSDKLARWLLLGLQGSLLDGLFVAPLRIASITVGLPPPPAAIGEAAQASSGCTSSAQQLAEQAAAALRRAVVDRTAALAAERLPPARQLVAPALHIHAPVAGAADAAAGNTESSSGGGSRDSQMQALGLAPSAARRVAGGSSVVWAAPPSAAFKWKQQQQLPAGGAAAAGAASAAPSGGSSSGSVHVLAGGATEAVAGITGLKVGAAKVQTGQPAPASAQPSVCKAALFARWQQLVAVLRSLPHGKQQAQQLPGNAAEAGDLKRSPARSLAYRGAKQAAGGAYAAVWRALLQPPSPLEGWIPKPPELEDFVL